MPLQSSYNRRAHPATLLLRSITLSTLMQMLNRSNQTLKIQEFLEDYLEELKDLKLMTLNDKDHYENFAPDSASTTKTGASTFFNGLSTCTTNFPRVPSNVFANTISPLCKEPLCIRKI